MLVQAEAEKQANELKQRSLTPLLIQQQFIEECKLIFRIFAERKLFEVIGCGGKDQTRMFIHDE